VASFAPIDREFVHDFCATRLVKAKYQTSRNGREDCLVIFVHSFHFNCQLLFLA